ncbi:YrdB family protein [Paenibacillus guangzhouensis]|uniref:YrdB family protein n=1 Tax=Paenibacillus guangzhouensis TaxID=1473112 RepID=UPI0012670333|nr:YrdB family protein [Paenibacillus guangzhouensis]
MVILKNVNLALAFLLELCALAALGYWGFTRPAGWLVKIILGIGTPVMTAFVWGLFVAPKATYVLPVVYKEIIAFAVFAIAAFALYAAGRSEWALWFAILVIGNRVLMYVWKN